VVGNKLPIFNPLVSLVVVVAVGEGVLTALEGGLGLSQAAKKKPLAMVAILKAREIRIFDIVSHTPQIFRRLDLVKLISSASTANNNILMTYLPEINLNSYFSPSWSGWFFHNSNTNFFARVRSDHFSC
jgi:hypothetical protein